MQPRSQYATDAEFTEALRDWFAGQALAGLEPPAVYVGAEETAKSHSAYARRAYRIADAMLTERAKAATPPTPDPLRDAAAELLAAAKHLNTVAEILWAKGDDMSGGPADAMQKAWARLDAAIARAEGR
ncbi:MAG: hypothetical protein WC869_11825 [Phycisphaerae bacterium]|jgi:hypothetical protein